jgi:preprotein translocase subunit SecF
VLPILALMVIAVWLLGVGTLMDLALVQLVGVIVGTYSSIYFATPLLVTLRERTEVVRTHTRRVLNRRKGSAARLSDAEVVEPASAATAAVRTTPPPDKPAPGARPVRPTSSRTGRPSGKRDTRRR